MKQLRRLLALTLVACMLLSNGSMAALAETPTEEPAAELLEESAGVLVLPASLTEIEDEAFCGDTSLEEVVLPEGLRRIGARAFAGSSLSRINLPDSLEEIGEDAFGEPGRVLITADPGSYAYDWAVKYGYLGESVAISPENFPNPRFLGYVTDTCDTDRDGQLSAQELAAVTMITLPNAGLTDLSGIGFFTSLRELNCAANPLTELDLSANTALEKLYCSACKLNALDLSANTALTALFCEGNPLGSLDVSQNTALRELSCVSCGLQELNLGANAALERLYCDRNPMDTLDVSGNAALQQLGCAYLNLSSLALDANPALTWLDCSGNPIGALVLSANTALRFLYCANCALEELDLSANTGLTDLNCSRNALSALELDASTALISLYCNQNELTALDVTRNPRLAVLECADNAITELNLSGNAALCALNCANNAITSLALGANTELWELVCNGNDIAALDVTACERLSLAYALGRQYGDGESYRTYHFGEGKGSYVLSIPYATTVMAEGAGLNISRETFPDESFYRYVGQNLDQDGDNRLSTKELLAVKELSLGDEGITNLEGVQFFSALEVLDCCPSNLFNTEGTVKVANLTWNTELREVNLFSNPIRSLNVSSLTKLESLNVGGTWMQWIDLYNNTELRELWINDADFRGIDLTRNAKLAVLDACGNENLHGIDLSGCPILATAYRDGGRQLAWLEEINPEAYETVRVYGGSGDGGMDDHDYILALSNWTNVHASHRPTVLTMNIGSIERIVTQRYTTYGYTDASGRYYPTDEAWEAIDCWPGDAHMELTVLRGGEPFTYNGTVNEVQELLANDGYDTDFGIVNDESPFALWEPGQHTALFLYGDQRAAFTVNVIECPVASVSVAPITRYIFDRNTMLDRMNEEGKWVYAPWTRVDCWPRDAEVTVSFTDGRDDYVGSFDEFVNQYDNELEIWWDSEESWDNQWEPGEHTARLSVCGIPCEYNVTVLPDPVEELSIDPEHSSIERFRFQTMEEWGWRDADGIWREGPWRRLDVTPYPGDDLRLTVSVNGESFTGCFDEVLEQMNEAGALEGELGFRFETDETPEDPWECGDSYTATMSLGGKSASYTVTVKPNPITEIRVPAITRFLGGAVQDMHGYEDSDGNWVDEDYTRLDVNPADETFTVVADGVSYTGNLDEIGRQLGEAYQFNFPMFFHWESDDTPAHPWNTVGEYTARQYIGDVYGEYTVHVVEYPVESVTFAPITRYLYDRSTMMERMDEDGRWYYDPWTRVDCWPRDAEITVTFNDGSEAITGAYDQVEEVLQERFEIWWDSDESWDAPWEAGEHTAWLNLSGVAWPYTVTVLDDPVVSIEIDPERSSIERYDYERSEQNGYPSEAGWIEQPWSRLDCWPRSDESFYVTVTLTSGESFSGTADQVQRALEDAGYRDLLGWESKESPDDIWEAGYDYLATLTAGGQSADYTVSVKSDPVESVTVEPITRYLFERDEWNHYDGEEIAWSRVDCWPHDSVVTVTFKDGREPVSGRLSEIEEELREEFELWWESEENPELQWQPGEHTAIFHVAGAECEYSVTVLKNPISELWVENVTHTIGRAEVWDEESASWQAFDRPEEEQDGDYWPEYIDCNPDVIHVTAEKDGEQLKFAGDEGAFHGWMQETFGTDLELSCHFAEDDNDFYPGGEYPAVLALCRHEQPILTASYTVTLIENPIKRLRIPQQEFSCFDRHESFSFKPDDGFWAPCEPWMQLDVMPEIEVTLADGTTLEGRADEVIAELNRRLEQEALHFYLLSEEKPWEPWYGGEHEAILTIGTTGYFYSFTVVNDVIAEVTVPDITRSVNCLSDWNEYDDEDGNRVLPDDFWRVEAHPESITVSLGENYRFENGEQTMTFENSEERGCLGLAMQALQEATGHEFILHWNSEERYDARWQAGEDGHAWVDIEAEGWRLQVPYTVHVTEYANRAVLLTDGPLQDGGFNQACFEAASEFFADDRSNLDCFELGMEDDPAEWIEFFIDLGSNIVILPGWIFEQAVAELAPEHPEVRFVLLDADPTSGGATTLPGNVYSAVYREELAGFMAGYAAVKLGCTELGFLGGIEVPAVMRYGYGFIQGADAAAAELEETVSVRYAYAGQFNPENWINEAMTAWYSNGVQVVFSCGGGIGESVAEAARETGGRIIGVDVDQAGDFGEKLTLTSAMKSLDVSVKTQLSAIFSDSFVGGTVAELGIVSAEPDENYVRLAPSTQFGEGFTEADYAALVAALYNGSLTVSSDISREVTALLSGAAAVSYDDLSAFRPERDD